MHTIAILGAAAGGIDDGGPGGCTATVKFYQFRYGADSTAALKAARNSDSDWNSFITPERYLRELLPHGTEAPDHEDPR